MSSTHLSLYFHIVFSTKNRLPFIDESWQDRLHHYLGGILRGLKGVSEGVGGTEDHIHILASLGAVHRLADVVRDLKSDSCKWVHGQILLPKFEWQSGYGGFSVGRSQLDSVKKYVLDQTEKNISGGIPRALAGEPDRIRRAVPVVTGKNLPPLGDCPNCDTQPRASGSAARD